MNWHSRLAEIFLVITLLASGVDVFAWWRQFMMFRPTSGKQKARAKPEVKAGQRTAELALASNRLGDEIAKREQIERALRESKERDRIVSELISDYVYALRVEPDNTLVCEWITGAFTRVTGFTPADVEKLGGWIGLVHADDLPIAQGHTQALAAGNKKFSEFRVVTKDQKVRWLRDQAYPVWDEVEGRVVRIYGAVQDVTEQKQMEQQLLQSERLAALGRLAASLAHEINNPLQIMRGYLDLLLDFPLESEEREYYLHIIWQEIERLSNINRHMLDYACPRPVQRQRVSVAALVEEVLVLTGKELRRSGVQVIKDLQEVPLVTAVPEQLVQVFLNLILNAIDAASDGGRLCIALYCENGHVTAAFTDNGSVIPAEVLPHIFEPFYTTKPKGSGLGLWISHTLVQKNLGTLGVENLESQRGVRFTVTLPAARHRSQENDDFFLSYKQHARDTAIDRR